MGHATMVRRVAANPLSRISAGVDNRVKWNETEQGDGCGLERRTSACECGGPYIMDDRFSGNQRIVPNEIWHDHGVADSRARLRGRLVLYRRRARLFARILGAFRAALAYRRERITLRDADSGHLVVAGVGSVGTVVSRG
jgi:hypothetical protein